MGAHWAHGCCTFHYAYVNSSRSTLISCTISVSSSQTLSYGCNGDRNNVDEVVEVSTPGINGQVDPK